MNRALKIQEILSIIFGHLHSHSVKTNLLLSLAALARTCQAFKEPALDMLWEKINDLSCLARCLPDASRRSCRQTYSRVYLFSRPLTQTEWDTLRSYTRRIRSIMYFNSGLEKDSLEILSNPPTAEPLFPNLRFLHGNYESGFVHLLDFPFPSLVSLNVNQGDGSFMCPDFLKSFSQSSPNLRRLTLSTNPPEATISNLVTDYIYRWKNIQAIILPAVTLNQDALVHLSCIPALTELEFELSTTSPTPHSTVILPNLHKMTVVSRHLEPLSSLLFKTQLPTIVMLAAFVHKPPSREDILSFCASVQTSNAGHTICRLSLQAWLSFPREQSHSDVLLRGKDLQSCMAFKNLRELELDLDCNVVLVDKELLALASAWPCLEVLAINRCAGWRMQSGITPDGLLQIMQTHRSMHDIALAIDTRGYIELPASGLLETIGSTVPRIHLNVLDSVIASESVPAMGAFLASTPHSCFFLTAWRDYVVKYHGSFVYEGRWHDVERWANGIPLSSFA